MIHELSRRGTNKFQAVNTAALPDTLFESEIFGYEKGAFTGRLRPQAGPAGDGQQRHALPRRNRRHVARRAGQAAARARGAPVRAARRQHPDRRQLPARSPRPTGRSTSSSATRASARICTTASTRSRSGCRRCASAPATSRCSRSAFSARYCAANDLPADGKSFSKEADRSPDALPLARQHPRAREHGRARRAVLARAASSGRPTSSSCTPARRRRNAPGHGCRPSPKPSAPTSPACSRACDGTRSRRPLSWTSAAARSIARSWNTGWRPSRNQRATALVDAATRHQAEIAH